MSDHAYDEKGQCNAAEQVAIGDRRIAKKVCPTCGRCPTCGFASRLPYFVPTIPDNPMQDIPYPDIAKWKTEKKPNLSF